MSKELTDKQKQILEILENCAGNVTQCCKKANISRDTFYRFSNDSDTFKKQVENIREGLIDFAESMLMKNIKAGKEPSIFFFLKTQAKHRGYWEKQEVTGKQSINLVIDETDVKI